MSGRRPSAALALAGATMAVSVSAVLVKEAHSDAATVVWLRMALAVMLLVPWAAPQLRPRTIGGPRQALVTAAAGAFLAVHFLAWTASLAYTSVAASVLLVSLHPLIVAPLGARLHGDEVGTRVVAGIGLALAGTVVTCAGGLGAGGNALGGDLLALAGGAALAGYLLIGRGLRERGGVAAYSAVVYAIVAAAGVGVAGLARTLHAPTVRTLVACLCLAAVCTVAGHTVFNWTLRRLPATMVSLSFLGEPVLAALLAFLILGQGVPLTTVVGGVLILAGLAAAVSSSSGARYSPAPAA